MQIDQTKFRYQKQRIAHWDQVSQRIANSKRPGAFYHKLLQHYYKFLISPGLRILEIGCGHGDLLAALKPSFGVGLDFSGEMIHQASQKHSHLHFVQADAHDLPIKEAFDVIILSDLVNDLWDVQCVFEKLRNISHPGTRLVQNFYNNLWRIPLSVVKWL
ncbi:MAG: class I SAM-dependent methyltransferase, partial [bacterium]